MQSVQYLLSLNFRGCFRTNNQNNFKCITALFCLNGECQREKDFSKNLFEQRYVMDLFQFEERMLTFIVVGHQLWESKFWFFVVQQEEYFLSDVSFQPIWHSHNSLNSLQRAGEVRPHNFSNGLQMAGVVCPYNSLNRLQRACEVRPYNSTNGPQRAFEVRPYNPPKSLQRAVIERHYNSLNRLAKACEVHHNTSTNCLQRACSSSNGSSIKSRHDELCQPVTNGKTGISV